MKTDHVHGGNVYDREIELDFSVNTNPLGAPKGVQEVLAQASELMARYPEPSYRTLRNAIREHEKRVYDEDIDINKIVVANGASALISALGQYLSKKRVYVCDPMFSGYERAFNASGAFESCFPSFELEGEGSFEEDDGELTYNGTLNEEILANLELLHPDAVCLCNPTNPSGALSDISMMEDLLSLCEEFGSLLIVDESFMDFVAGCEQESMVRHVNTSANIIVIRSMTKIYAMPGLRLGYAYFGDPEIAEKIRELLPEWCVSTVAQAAGTAALKDDEKYLFETREFVAVEREYMEEKLAAMGLTVYPSVTDYLMIYSEQDLFEPLYEHGVLIRMCDNFRSIPCRGYYRIAVRTREENDRLLCMIEEILR